MKSIISILSTILVFVLVGSVSAQPPWAGKHRGHAPKDLKQSPDQKMESSKEWQHAGPKEMQRGERPKFGPQMGPKHFGPKFGPQMGPKHFGLKFGPQMGPKHFGPKFGPQMGPKHFGPKEPKPHKMDRKVCPFCGSVMV